MFALWGPITDLILSSNITCRTRLTRTYFGFKVAQVINMRTNWAKAAFTLSARSYSNGTPLSTVVADKT